MSHSTAGHIRYRANLAHSADSRALSAFFTAPRFPVMAFASGLGMHQQRCNSFRICFKHLPVG